MKHARLALASAALLLAACTPPAAELDAYTKVPISPFLGKPVPDLPFPKANVTHVRWMDIASLVDKRQSPWSRWLLPIPPSLFPLLSPNPIFPCPSSLFLVLLSLCV